MLAARTATAIVGVPIILALVWFGGPPLWILVALAAGLAGWEALNLLRAASPDPHPNPLPEGEGISSPSQSPMERGQGGEATRIDRGLDVWSVLTILGASTFVLATVISPAAGLAVIGLVLIAALALSLGRSSSTTFPGSDWSVVLAAVVYAGLPLALLVSIRQWPGQTPLVIVPLGAMARGTGWLLMTLTGVWAVDTVAYVVGRLVGRRRLWPRISPNKTWEGTIGGAIAGVLVCEAWASTLQIASGLALALGIALAVGAVTGDLAESALKRQAHVKDAGSFLPGHGGLLDRIDSLAFSAVVVFFSGILIGSAGTRPLF